MQTSTIHLFLIFLYYAWLGADKYLSFMYCTTCFAEAATISKPGCPSKCGNLTVPYPFGIGANSRCSINPFFAINCDASFNPPKAFLSVERLEVVEIHEATVNIKNRLAVECYDQDGNETSEIGFFMNLSSTPFSFSNENMLTVVGCDDASYLSRDSEEDDESDLVSSCAAMCSRPGELSNGFCSGIGCCQSAIPKGLQSTYVEMATASDHTKVHNFSSCGYSFLAGKNSYSFNVSDVSDSSFASRIIETVPIVIDWAIGNQNCNQMNASEIICQPNTACVDYASTLGGYRCNCSPGYQGNPYLSPGGGMQREFLHQSDQQAL